MKNVRKLLQDKSKPLVMPGVYDAIGAKIVEKVGFEAMFQTGYGTSPRLRIYRLLQQGKPVCQY